jgi:hypothetical protein
LIPIASLPTKNKNDPALLGKLLGNVCLL